MLAPFLLYFSPSSSVSGMILPYWGAAHEPNALLLSIRSWRLERVGRGLLLPVVPSEALEPPRTRAATPSLARTLLPSLTNAPFSTTLELGGGLSLGFVRALLRIFIQHHNI